MSYPLKYYAHVVDKLRHWITTLDEGTEFSIAEASEAVGHSVGRQLAHLANRTEISRARRGVYRSLGPGYVDTWWDTMDWLLKLMEQRPDCKDFEYEKYEF